MKKVIFVRHAKSSWADPGLRDIERPLNKRGKRDAPFMAELMRRKGIRPDRLISSTAVRAVKTAAYFAREFSIPVHELILEQKIYHAFPADILQYLQSLDDEIKCAMLVGHNPTMTSLANLFSDRYIDNIPTCGVFEVESDVVGWGKFNPDTGKMTALHYPKQYFKK